MLSQQLARTDCARQPFDSISLRLWNDVRIQSERDPGVAVSQLCADGSDARALVDQRCRNTMPKGMETRQGNPKRTE